MHLSGGVLLALTAAALFGASTPLSKVLLDQLDPLTLAGLLYLSAGLGLAALYAARRLLRPWRAEANLSRADAPWLVGMVVSGGIVAPVLLLVGLRATPATTASLLLNLEALTTMLIAWLVTREFVDRRLLTGAVAILSGAVVLGWQGAGTFSWGAVAIAGACVAWGVDNNLTRKLSHADPVQITMIKGLVAGSVNVALAAGMGASLPAPSALAGGAAVGFFGYGVSLVLFVLALRYLGTARTSAYFSTAPFIGAALSVALLGDALTIQMAVAGLLMGLGVYLHITERHLHEHRHDPLTHEHAHVHDEHHQHPHGPHDPAGEPHVHIHAHAPLRHAHRHFPDLHHRHEH